MTPREQAIKDFTREATWEQNLGELLAYVAQRKPKGVLVVWEEAGGRIGAATSPDSIMLAKGLADAIYEMLWVSEEEIESSSDEESDA